MTETEEKIMKSFCAASCSLLMTLTAVAGQSNDPNVGLAREATAAYASALKAELVQAMQSDGPLTAIEVCQIRAPAISSEISLDKGLTVSRVSLKNRNPANQPTAWQASVLETFETRKQSGEDPATLSWSETVSIGDGKEFRFMKAIPTGGVCLQCHGQDIAPPVAEKLAELYPTDKATGFSMGDLRGAFVVTRQLD